MSYKTMQIFFCIGQDMLLLLLILVIQHTSGEDNLLTNDTLDYMKKLNGLQYSHDSTVTGRQAEFSFTLSNTTYAREVLYIESYYYSITFIEENSREERLPVMNLTNEIKQHDTLIMKNLEEEGNYLICVFFLNQSTVIGSSRFCHVISVSGNCELEETEKTFTNRHIYILLIFVFVLLVATVIFTCVRAYINRPRTIEALFETFPEHHTENLKTLAPVADNRRRRRTQPALNSRLREDSVLSVIYEPNGDGDYHNYHGTDNLSLDTVPE